MTIAYRGNWLTVRHEPMRLANGRTITAEFVERPDGVRVIAHDAAGHILLNDEYRAELGTRDMRLPGGKVENGHAPIDAAARELREETGFRAALWTPLGSSQPFAMVRYRLHYFEARELTFEPIEHDEGEDIDVRWVTLAQAADLALSGAIGEDSSALQILRLGAREDVP